MRTNSFVKNDTHGVLSTPELLRESVLREILQPRGPCITMLVPPYHPGEPAGSPATVLRANLQEVARQVEERSSSESAAIQLLQPLEELADDLGFAAGSHWGRVIFRSPGIFRQFYLTQPVKAALRLGGSFAIRQLTGELALPRIFYILFLSKTKVSLLRCSGLEAEPVPLPASIPATLSDAMAFEPPDHDLESRSAVGSSTGAMRAARFGTGTGRERERTHLADFYKLVDRGLQRFIHEPETPMILAGVEEDAAIFRAVSTYPDLIEEGIAGSVDVSSRKEEMLAGAYPILRRADLSRQAGALVTAWERTAAPRLSTDPNAVLCAAFEGRVGQLYVNQSAERVDVFERGSYQSWGKEDLLNLAIVETIIHHGKACVLPPERMPEECAVVGILRF